ncbi:MAG: hypothetical protein J2P50_14010, partial [Hyphomicrobiaceae bacterium]|nr:hypothetical protein [Hyphomicrobiaceae bacterium]
MPEAAAVSTGRPAASCRRPTAAWLLAARRTVDQLKAIFGWVTNQQPKLYVREANRRRLGSAAPDLLAPARCLGSDAWRYVNGAVCSSRPVRQDLLDHVVWNEVVRLLEHPRLIEGELNPRLEAAQNTAPTKRRRETLERDLTRVCKSIER